MDSSNPTTDARDLPGRRCRRTTGALPSVPGRGAALRAVGLGWLATALLGGAATAQDPFDSGPTDGMFSLRRSQDDIAEWQEARAEIDARDYEPAVERLHRLLQDGSHGIVPVLGSVGRWTGLRQAIVQSLRDLPPAGVEAYERLCRREAGRAYGAPLGAASVEELVHLATRFPTSSRGIAARIRLGDLALVRGDGLRSQQHFRAALDATTPASPTAARIAERLRAADLLVRGMLAPLSSDGDLSAAVAEALPRLGTADWTAYGGGYDGSLPMDPPVGESAEPYRVPVRADGFELNDYPMHAVGDLSGVFVNDGHSLRAVDPLGRRVLWEAPGPMIDSQDIAEASGAINSDMVLACALGQGVVVASLQVPNDIVGAEQTQRFRNVIPIVRKIPSRRLFAFDRRTGKRLWAHWDYEKGPVTSRYHGHDACGAPIVSGDTIYVATHDQTGAIAFYVSAYDLHTGEPRWRQLICSSQQEVNMFGNARQEFAAGPVALHGGVVYGTTNLGVSYAVDAEDGDVRWVAEYPAIPLPPAQLRHQESRPVFFANNPIAITEGVMATTPLDSEFALGIDIETGRILWQLPYDARNATYVRWLLGPLGDEFVFAGLGIVAVRARPDQAGRAQARLVASAEALGEEHYRSAAIPRGALTEDRIWYIGSDGGFRILDQRGTRDPRMARLQLGVRGNLLMVDGIIATLSDGQLLIWSDLEGMVRDARRRANAAPDDPAVLLRLATLLRARGTASSAQSETLEHLYQRGLTAAHDSGLGAGSPVLQQLADGLFALSMTRAERLVERDPRRARAMIETARARATLPRQWLRAQTALLGVLGDDSARYLEELRRMAERYPDESHVFPGVGPAPISVYALWRSIEHLTDPRDAVRTCQSLLDRHRDVPLGDQTAGERARQLLVDLVAEHGQDVLADIEAAATRELEEARGDAEILRRLRERYPLTEAARTAAIRMLDAALQARDLRAAAAAFADGKEDGAPNPAALRRMVEAARLGGNLPLAHALAWRLVSTSGALVSDFGPDAGRTYSQTLSSLEAPAVAAAVSAGLPLEVIATLEPPNLQTSYSYIPVRVADGFPAPAVLPLFSTPDEERIFAFELSAASFDPNAAVAIGSKQGSLDGPLLLCGDIVVGVDAARAFGVDYKAGVEAWELPAAEAGGLLSLGIRSGVLHLYAFDATTRGDGGELLGVEPTSGALLFSVRLAWDRVATPPVPTAGALWLLDSSDPASPAFRTLDPLDGTEVERTPIPADALRFLGLAEPGARRLNDPAVRTGFFADARHVYLPVNLSTPDDPSRLVALRRGSGEVAWRWTSLPGNSIQRAGLHEGRVIVFGKGASRARLSILDARGNAETRPFEFGRVAQTRNWNRTLRGETVPSTILVSDLVDSLRLTCVSILPDGPRFRHKLENVGRILREPRLGSGFFLLPFSRQGRSEPTLEVLDLRTRAGALPGGERALRLGLAAPVKVFVHDRFVVVETYESLRVLGTGD